MDYLDQILSIPSPLERVIYEYSPQYNLNPFQFIFQLKLAGNALQLPKYHPKHKNKTRG